VHFKDIKQSTLDFRQYNSALVSTGMEGEGEEAILISRFLHSLSQQTARSSTVTKLDSEAGINILPPGI
jgi:hypothetical protein